MPTEVVAVRIDSNIIKMLKNAGIDPKKEVREYLQTLARIAEKKRIAKELRTERIGATNMNKVVKWIREDRER